MNVAEHPLKLSLMLRHTLAGYELYMQSLQDCVLKGEVMSCSEGRTMNGKQMCGLAATGLGTILRRTTSVATTRLMHITVNLSGLLVHKITTSLRLSLRLQSSSRLNFPSLFFHFAL